MLANSSCRVGILYNALPGEENKAAVEAWAKQNYPDAWAELETKEKIIDKEDGFELFNIVREWKA
jgi:hypothetical protein